MGWTNPPVPWSELERVMSGRAPGRGSGPRHMVRSVPASTKPEAAPPDPQPPVGQLTTVPYAELHAHTAFSFLDGSSTPEQLVAEALRLGLTGLAVTDHDGLYGIVRFAEAAAGTGLRTIYGAELSLGLPGPQLGVPDPVGDHLLVLARGQEGYRRLSLQISRAQLAGKEKGRPVYDLDALADAAGDQWLILSGCRKGRVRRALATGGPDAARRAVLTLVERFGNGNVAVELTKQLTPVDDEDNDGGGDHRRALRDPAGLPAGRGDGGSAGAPQPGGGGPLPAGGTRGTPAVRSRDGRTVRALPDRGACRGGARRGVLLRSDAGGPAVAALPGAARPG